jgi:MraZ protein
MERASFLTGEFRHALDDRGRVAVPARFRGRMAAGATLARWLDRCLGLFPQDEWDELAGKLRSLPLTNPRAREFARVK